MAKKKTSSSVKKIVYWIIAILLFYLFTTATVSTKTVEVEKKIEQRYTIQEPVVVEKLIRTTKYKEEKTPFGVPRCEQMNYNFTYTLAYSEEFVGDKKVGTCNFEVTNQEDIAGKFTFYVQFLKNGNINDGPEQTKEIDALSKETYTWKLSVEPFESLSCMMQTDSPPQRMKCFYLEPITYQIKRTPYVVEELKNITEFIPANKTKVTMEKQNVTMDVYTNRFFNYQQFFYFGY
jgi:hypothetical protein